MKKYLLLLALILTFAKCNSQVVIPGVVSSSKNIIHVSAPSELTAEPFSANQINLTWTDNSNNESGFVLERTTTSGTGYTVIYTSSPNTTTYEDTGLSSGTVYYYRVKAIIGSFSSPYSDETNSETFRLPSAPSGLAANTISVSQINLTWTDNSDNEDGFEVYRSLTTSTGFVLIDTASVNATSYSATGLSSSTTYYFKIRAINSFGASSYSSEVNATTSAPALIPTAPSGLIAENGGATSVNLTWADNSNNETGFEIHRSTTSGSGFSLIFTTGPDITTYTNTGLTTGTTYYYKVRAVNGVGNSSFTSEASATPNTPLAPSGLAVNLNTNPTSSTGGGTISWTDNSSNETGFEVYRSLTPNTGFSLVNTTAANATTYTETALLEGQRYYYKVRAVNGATASAYTSQVHDIATWSSPIALVAQSATLASSTTSTLSISLPISPAPATGNMMIMLVATKLAVHRALPPTGWREADSYLDNTNSNGTNGGPIRISIFWKIATSPETSPVAVSLYNTASSTGNFSIGKVLVFSKDSDAFWSVEWSGGSHNTTGTNSYSATSWENLSLIKGDVLAMASAINSSGITWSAQALTHPLATFTENTEEIFDTGASVGNRGAITASMYTVSNNSTSTGQKAVFTMTGSTSTTTAPIGVTAFMRLRNARTQPTYNPPLRIFRAADAVDVVAGGDATTVFDGLRVSSAGSDPGTKKYSVVTFNGRPCYKLFADFTVAGTDATVNYRSELHENPPLPGYPIGTQIITEFKFETDATATQGTTEWLFVQNHTGTAPGFSSNSPIFSLAFTFNGQSGFDNTAGTSTGRQLQLINAVDDPDIAGYQYLRYRFTGYDWGANNVYRVRYHIRFDVKTGDPVMKLWASKNGSAMTLLYEDYTYPTVTLTDAEVGSNSMVGGTAKFGIYEHGLKTETARAAAVAAGHPSSTLYIPCYKQIIMLPGDAGYFTDYTNNSATIYNLVDTSTE